MGRSKDWSYCSDCGKKTKGNYIGERGFVCFNCSRKKMHQIPRGRQAFTMKEALEQTRDVRVQRVKMDWGYNVTGGMIHVPKVLAGKKVKLVLVKE